MNRLGDDLNGCRDPLVDLQSFSSTMGRQTIIGESQPCNGRATSSSNIGHKLHDVSEKKNISKPLLVLLLIQQNLLFMSFHEVKPLTKDYYKLSIHLKSKLNNFNSLIFAKCYYWDLTAVRNCCFFYSLHKTFSNKFNNTNYCG